jgi:hypothetical protein
MRALTAAALGNARRYWRNWMVFLNMDGGLRWMSSRPWKSLGDSRIAFEAFLDHLGGSGGSCRTHVCKKSNVDSFGTSVKGSALYSNIDDLFTKYVGKCHSAPVIQVVALNN